MGILLMYVGFIAFFYFFMIRPQRKKQKETNDMRSSLKVGDPVITAGGLYGKIIEEINDNLIVEFGTNKSVRVPMKREAIVGVEEPDLKIKKEEIAEEK